MEQKQRLLARADTLIEEGRAVLRTRARQGGEHVDHPIWRSWNLKVQTLIKQVEPEKGHYHEEVTQEASRFGTNADQAQECLAALQALRDDIDNDMFVRVEDLVSAAIFDDLLTQAEHLLEAGYPMPAAALTGAVLERELRTVAKRQDLWKKGDMLAKLNQKLVSAQAYGAVKKSKVDTWTKIRNNADHGELEKVKPDEVRQMIEGVRNFIDSMLSV